jgi:hypothetical protein
MVAAAILILVIPWVGYQPVSVLASKSQVLAFILFSWASWAIYFIAALLIALAAPPAQRRNCRLLAALAVTQGVLGILFLLVEVAWDTIVR